MCVLTGNRASVSVSVLQCSPAEMDIECSAPCYEEQVRSNLDAVVTDTAFYCPESC